MRTIYFKDGREALIEQCVLDKIRNTIVNGGANDWQCVSGANGEAVFMFRLSEVTYIK